MKKVMEGIGSIALLPCGSISGHFIHLPNSVSYALHGTQIACERECSRGEDYRLINLTIFDYSSRRERDVIVECKGHDAARFHNVDQAHGWEEDVIGLVEQKKQEKDEILVSFECETLKADEAAEDHIRKFIPNLIGLDAVVNVGRMTITGLDFSLEDESNEDTAEKQDRDFSLEDECIEKDTAEKQDRDFSLEDERIEKDMAEKQDLDFSLENESNEKDTAKEDD